MSADYFIFDLETLSTHNNALILSISFCCGDYQRQGPEHAIEYVRERGETYRLPIEMQKNRFGRHVEDDTLAWWKNHNDAFEVVMSAGNRIDCSELYPRIVKHLSLYEYDQKETVVWLRAPHFDQPILESFFETVHGKKGVPYSHWKIRDVRTAIDIATGSNNGYPENNRDVGDKFGIRKHVPIDDIALDVALLEEFCLL